MRGPKFFCSNLLLSLLSTQLYHDSSINNYCSHQDLFLNYLYSRAEVELRGALHTGSGKQFSEALSVQLVRGLMINATYEISDNRSGNGHVSSARNQSNLLTHLVKVLGRTAIAISNADITGANTTKQSLLGIANRSTP